MQNVNIIIKRCGQWEKIQIEIDRTTINLGLLNKKEKEHFKNQLLEAGKLLDE